MTTSRNVELEHLRRWKTEAMHVLIEWEKVWLAAGQPGPIGSSKAANVRRFIEDMIAAPDEVAPEWTTLARCVRDCVDSDFSIWSRDQLRTYLHDDFDPYLASQAAP